jgi:hypothetical protein
LQHLQIPTAMTTPTLPFAAPDSASRLDGVLRALVALVGLVEGCIGPHSLMSLLGCNGLNLTGGTAPDLTFLASLALQPLLGCAVVVCALSRRLPAAIVALALLMLARWSSEVPSIVHHGLGLAGDPLVVLHRLFRAVLQPVVALAAIAAARPNGNVAAAAIAVIVPGLLEVAGVAAFLISVGAPGL